MVVVTDSVITTGDSGQRWTTETSPRLASSGDRLVSVSCVSSTLCWSASEQGSMFKTTDGGRSWISQSLPGPVDGLTSVWCLDSQHCWAPGTTGPSVIFHTKDGGSNWSSSSVYSTGAGAQSVSCPTTMTCWAAGAVETLPIKPALLKSTDGGVTWALSSTYPTTNGGLFLGISCASTQDCTAVGDNNATSPLLDATTDGGVRWSLEATPTDPWQLYSVSCTTATGCWSVGAEGSGQSQPTKLSYTAKPSALPARSCTRQNQTSTRYRA